MIDITTRLRPRTLRKNLPQNYPTTAKPPVPIVRKLSVGIIEGAVSRVIVDTKRPLQGYASPVQVENRSEFFERGSLVAHTGLGFRLSQRNRIGRVRSKNITFLIDHLGISRSHAELFWGKGIWRVRDLGSTNGTFVNSIRVGPDAVALESGDRIRFGSIRFLFLDDRNNLSSAEGARDSHKTPSIEFDHEEGKGVESTQVLATGLSLLEDPLPLRQQQLLTRLLEQWVADARLPAGLRGFVLTHELIKSVDWITPSPSPVHLKQLVKRLRRSLKVTDSRLRIEGKHGSGYRVQLGHD